MEQKININPDEIQNIIISANTPQSIKLKNLSLNTIEINQDKIQNIDIDNEKNQTIYIDKNGTGYSVTDVIVNGISVVVDGIAYVTVPTKTSELTNNSGYITLGDLSRVATTGNYNDLINKPVIPSVPTKTSDLTNDSGFITKDVNDLTNYTLTNNFSDVAFTGDYDDLTDKPSIPTQVSELSNDMEYVTKDVNDLTYYTESRYYSEVATTGNYNDLFNKPSIPSKTSDLVNDSGFITDSYHDSTKQDTLISGTNIKTINNTSLLGSGNITISSGGTATDVQINGTSITSSNIANIITNSAYNQSSNKIATMNDLPSVPTKTSDLTNDSGFITNTVNNLTNYTLSSNLSTVATTGDYDDLIDKPSIPTKTSDLNNDSGFITNSVNNLTNYTLSSNLSTVATTGDYDDLIDKPSIPSKTSDLNNDSGFITNTVNNLTNYTLSSNLSTVATTGNYNDLSNKPTIPTKTSDLVNDSGFITETNSIYSTSEVKIGTWLNKPLYRKVVTFTTTSSTYSITTQASGISNADTIYIAGGFIKNGNIINSINTARIHSNAIYNNDYSWFRLNGTDINYEVASNSAGKTAYIIIEYTKTTD